MTWNVKEWDGYPKEGDRRLVVLFILLTYLVLGFTVLGFNRTPQQVLIIAFAAVSLEFFLHFAIKRRPVLPLSSLITACGLSILLNYSHSFHLLLVPVFFAIGSKYLFVFKGRHVYNPAQFAVSASLFCTAELITAAPAYQWNGFSAMSAFIVLPAFLFFMGAIKRNALVAAFLITFTICTALRAMVMRHHLPFETLFFGTLSSPSFFLFTFFMITDPATSPPGRKQQIQAGIAIAVIDLLLHLMQSYYTFFYAAFLYGSYRFLSNHFNESRKVGFKAYLSSAFSNPVYARAVVVTLLVGAALGLYVGRTLAVPKLLAEDAGLKLEEITPSHSGIAPTFGDVYTRVDERVQHIVKWLFSVGDTVAAGDYDGDGFQDLFFTFPLKSDADRLSLMRNKGNFQFERVSLPAVANRAKDIEQWGLPTCALFVDYDNDNDLDLFVCYAFGGHLVLRNELAQSGSATFTDISGELGLEPYANALTAIFSDLNRDGRLDLLVGNVLPKELRDYETPTPLNIFKLPPPAHEGDRRALRFMHESWHQAGNGGMNELYLQDSSGRFGLEDPKKWNLLDTRWTISIASGDLNQDGWPDIYVANDFGPDNLYLNDRGQSFKDLKGEWFGEVGRDTYKGMNSSIADLDGDGWLDVYVSNVHHALQAEGSLLWLFGKGKDPMTPKIEDAATRLGALNENRFGWGASAADFNNDGELDLAQANGMVDDSIDKKWDECPDFWYSNEKVARSGPEIHSYADKWADIRGRCVYGKEKNRLYINRGANFTPRFVDVADSVGLGKETNSRGAASVDLDNDGRLDLVITHIFSPPSIYRNVPPSASSVPTSWAGLQLKSDSPTCNRDGIGSFVTMTSINCDQTKKIQVRESQSINGFSAQDDRRIHFGLGCTAQGEVPTVEVRWCGQEKERFEVRLNTYQVLKRGSGTAVESAAP